ncbi:hypothetical protein TNCV_1423411 [Trichonephila clavipes]|nr:hypothetical protein TNCV_1423411 [Trichonephila clavipes]
MEVIEDTHKDSTHGGHLAFSEIATRIKQDISSSWRQAPVHEWYEGNHPGTVLLETGTKRDQTALARFRSEHTSPKWHVEGLKVYPSCPNCNAIQDAPANILACIGCNKSSWSQVLLLYSSKLKKTHRFMDLI